MRGIFWTHLDSVKLLNLFSIVLIMDITYKTNKYIITLLWIVGMMPIYPNCLKHISGKYDINVTYNRMWQVYNMISSKGTTSLRFSYGLYMTLGGVSASIIRLYSEIFVFVLFIAPSIHFGNKLHISALVTSFTNI